MIEAARQTFRQMLGLRLPLKICSRPASKFSSFFLFLILLGLIFRPIGADGSSELLGTQNTIQQVFTYLPEFQPEELVKSQWNKQSL